MDTLVDRVRTLCRTATRRQGNRPLTTRRPPHVQLNQWPSADLIEELERRSCNLPFVSRGHSSMAADQVLALVADDEVAVGPPEAFIGNYGFCHLHSAPSGAVHLTLPEDVRGHFIRLGWAEPHIITVALPTSLVMVYGPRDAYELDIVSGLVEASLCFACGKLP